MDRLSEFAASYPCLWNPYDRNYSNETVKAAARIHLLKKCNETAEVPLDMPTLVHLIGVIYPQKTQTETNPTPGSRLVMEIDGAKIRKQSDTNTQTSAPLSAPMSESTIVMENNSVKKENPRPPPEPTPMILLRSRRVIEAKKQTSSSSQSESNLSTSTSLPVLASDAEIAIENVSAEENTSSELNLPSTASQPTAMPTEVTEIAGDKNKKPTLEDLVVEYPCLWDHNDLNFTDVKMKERSREKVVERFNSYSSVPITIEYLNKKLDCMRVRLNRQRRRKRKALNQTTASAKTASESAGVHRRPHQVFDDMVAEFPCLWDPNDPYRNNKKMKNRCQEILLEKFNRQSSVQITIQQLKRKLKASRVRLTRTKTTSSELNLPSTASQPTAMSTEVTEIAGDKNKKPTLEELVVEYPCLWDHNDLNFTDVKMKERSREKVVERFNSYSSVPITIEYLNKKLDRMRVRLNRQRRRKRKALNQTTTSASKTVSESAGVNRRPHQAFDDMVAEFPCLWDPNDPYRNNKKMKNRCQEILLEKFNRQSSVQITIQQLKRKLKASRVRQTRTKTTSSELNLPSTASQPTAMSTEVTEIAGDKNKKPTLEELVVEYPCLWDHNDLNFTDVTMKERSREKVVERFNSFSSVPITIEYLKKKLDCMRVRLNKQRRKKRKALNQQTASASKSVGVNRKPNQAFEDMVAEFPCLWDSNDPYRNNQKMKDRCHEILLEKFNRQSSVQITIQELKRKLKALRVRQSRTKTLRTRNQPLTRALVETDAAKKHTLKELVAPYPCLWDPNDLNRFDLTMKARCREQLLAKFNDLSSEPITMEELKRKLTNLNARLREREALLGKFNDLTSEPNNLEQLKTKLTNLNGLLREREAQAKLAGESATDPARILTWNLPQDAASDSNACQIINEYQDTANQVVLGTVISFDWCRICGELKKHCVDATSDEKPYIARKKTKLAINDLDIELDFADNKLPTNICEDCDKKLEDMYKFIELVKSTQDNFNNLFNNATQKATLNETENNENTERKKVKVIIDLNAIAAPKLDGNIQEVLGTGQCTDENEVKMKMMRNTEHDNDSDDYNLVIKVENPYDDDNNYKMAEQSDNVDFTSLGDVDENDMKIKSIIEVSPVTVSKGSGNVSDEINKCRVSEDMTQNFIDSNNDGRHLESVGVISNDNSFKDDRNLDQVITLDNGIKIVLGGNINNGQSSITDICEENAAIVDIKKEVIDINEEQNVVQYVLNEEDGITIKEENIGIDDSILGKNKLS